MGKNVFERIDDAKKILSPLIKDKTDQEIKLILCHCVNTQNGRKYNRDKYEIQFNDFLLKNELSAKTLYEYFLVLDYPQHIKAQLKDKKIGINKAQRLAFTHRKMTSRKGTKKLMEEMRNIIRRLEWRNQDTINKI